jgi:uncharacterized YccA/Bax inhibitor family protein
MFSGANPAINAAEQRDWREISNETFGSIKAKSNAMSINGTAFASMCLLGLTVISSVVGWNLVQSNPSWMMPLSIGSFVLGLLTCFVLFRFPRAAAYASPIYAILQGLFVGGVSYVYANMTTGTKAGSLTGPMMILTASMATFATTFAMLAVYAFRIYRPGRMFYNMLMVVGGGLMVFFLGTMALRLFGVDLPLLNAKPVAIGITVVVLIYSAFLLLADFDFINTQVEAGAPKYMEWYAGFALLVTLVMLYLNFLRLLSLLRSDD